VAWARGFEPDAAISYEVVLYDDDGPDGDPGTLLAKVPTSASDVPGYFDAPGYQFSSTPVALHSAAAGFIYIGFRYDPSVEQNFFFPIDDSASTPAQVIHSSTNDGSSWIYTTSLGRALFVRASFTGKYVVLPPTQELATGNTNNEDVPFGVIHSRYQQVYLGTEIGSRWISEIRFRGAWGEGGGPICPEPFSGATIKLSTTQQAVDDLSTTFSTNVGADETVVFQGNLWIASRGSGMPGLDPFDISIPLQQRFYFGGSNNLLLDINLPNGYFYSFHFLDAHDAADGVSRVYCADSLLCNTSSTAQAEDSVGLVTMFLDTDLSIFADDFESGNTSAWSNTVP
jgi:hypothetical protein